MTYGKKYWLPILSVLLWALAPQAWANCYRVLGTNANAGATSQYIKPGEGVAANWSGACDTCNGSLGLPSVINLPNGGFIPPGTLLANGIAPMTQYGATSGYDPERVFVRCAPGDAVYEMYSTNADNYYSGAELGAQTGAAMGLEAAYDTIWNNTVLRLTNVTTGEYVTHIWKERLLTDLDTDSHGYQLVKAKNLSMIRAEIFSTAGNRYYIYGSNYASQLYSYTQPNAYIALRGPGLAGPRTGVSHAGDFTGWPANWPGAIGLYNFVTLKRYPTCVVVNATPFVFLPTLRLNDVQNNDATSEASFQISFKCQDDPGMVSGTGNNQTAMGILASSASYAAARNLGLVNASSGISHLVSENYGNARIAEGVGIRILRDGQEINLLSSENSGLGGADANARGWYPVIGNNSVLTGDSAGVRYYTENFQARLEKLPQATHVTPGRVRATATVVIRVQ